MLKHKKLIRTNVMFNKNLLNSIDKFANIIEEDRSTAIRQLIKKAIVAEKIETAVKKFEEGISFRDAAKTAGLDYWDFQIELDKRGIPIMRSLHLAQKKS